MPDLISTISPIPTDTERPSFAHDPEKLNNWMRGIATNNPGFVSVKEIGRSLENRPILALVIGGASPGNTSIPTIQDVHVGGLHGRELMPPDALLHGVEELLEDGWFRERLQQNGIAVIPCANPDGRSRVLRGLETPMYLADRLRYSDVWHRGNTRGVDLNRNFPIDWHKLPTHQPGHPNMKGESPLSEPETAAIAEFIEQTKPNAVVDWHSPGNLIYPSNDAALSEAIAGATGLAVFGKKKMSSSQNGGTLKSWASANGASATTVELGFTHHGSDELFPAAVRQAKQGIIATHNFLVQK